MFKTIGTLTIIFTLTGCCAACSGGESAPPTDLAGTEWILTALNGAAPLPDTQITLNFTAEEATGFAGCNSYGGRYATTGRGGLRISEMAITLELCLSPTGVVEQEEAYIQALTAVAAYRIADGRLELRNARGQAILAFTQKQEQAMRPADLVGTRWQLTSWGDHTLVEGSVITIAFGEETLSGYAGCRSYVAPYRAEGDNLTLLMLTMMDSSDPCADALMEQEGAYTTSLEEVTNYRLNEGQLELLTARGETLLFAPQVDTQMSE